MQKIIVHIMNKKWFKTDTFKLELHLMKEIYKQDNVENFLFYKGQKLDDKDYEEKLNKNGIYLKNYLNGDDITQKVEKLNKKYNILYVHTTLELTMNVTNRLKKVVGQEAPKNHRIFRNKFIQREMILKHNPELGIRFTSGTLDKLSFSEIREKVGVPFILKPINGVQSSGVVKINSRREFYDYKDHFNSFSKVFSERGIEGGKLIAEEYIDGELYSIDYFVGQDGSVRLSEPIKERLGTDIGVDDYFVLSRITTKDTQDTFRYINLEKFVKDSVKAMKIKNSFVHHEFKINSKGQLKTIEVNGRIGGGRHELMHRAFGINFFKFIVDSKKEFPKIKENVIGVNLFATKEGKFLGFNKELFSKIEKLDSAYRIVKDESAIGKDYGLTKDGFIKIGTIKLSNTDLQQLRNDYLFIEKNYKKLLEIESKYICVTKIIKIFRLNF